ncbi:TetR/AcrR family transcriptional regulator [Micromonospora sp. NPDC023814]|uniref:TetR/AcrR family transcriptional regulator n=1 Tax=Micromonospora sp. NPDC023814 TaxID=3154596 RepID=UPI00340A3229
MRSTSKAAAAVAMTPATAKGEQTRAFLLTTAARVFAEGGYTATTMADLITASGLTKGAFYFYFRSKSDLALAVLADQQARWLSRVHQDVMSEPTAAAQLRALVPAMLRLIEDDPGAWSITRLTKELAADADVAAEVGKPMADWVALVADIVRRGQAEGELRTGLDPHAVAAVLVGAFDGLKTITDILTEAGDPAQRATAFQNRAHTLLALVEQALLAPSPDDAEPPS